MLIFNYIPIIGLSQEKQNDSSLLNKVSRFKMISYSGNIQLETQYGLLPYSMEISTPQSNTILSGNTGVELGKIPLRISFYYSSLGYVSGINNYVRFSFDANQYKKNESIAKSKLNENHDLNIDSLYTIRQDYTQKIAFIDYIKASDSLGQKSLGVNAPDFDSTYKEQSPNYNSNGFQDSLTTRKNTMSSEINKVENLIKGYESLKKINLSKIQIDSVEVKKPKSPFEYVKKIELGMCYPNYSKFLVANIPITGVSGEFQVNKVFIGFTYGKTISNFQDFTNESKPSLNIENSVLSMLGMPDNPAGKLVGVLKTGYGTLEGSHIFIGGLYGSSNDNDVLNPYRNIHETRNIVFEVDGRLRIAKNHTIDLILAKSKNIVVSPEFSGAKFNAKDFLSSKNNHAVSLIYTGSLKKTGTTYSISHRYIEPFFESYGVGFLRSDNSSTSVKVNQKLATKLSVSGNIRYHYDDVKNILGISNELLTYGASITFRPTRSLLIKGAYKPISLNTFQNQLEVYKSNNSVLNVLATYNIRKKQNLFLGSIMFLRYDLSNDINRQSVSNFNITLSESINNRWLYEISANYLINSDTNSYSDYMLLFKVGFKDKKYSVSTTLKNTLNEQDMAYDYGFVLGGKYKVFKSLFAKFSVEKVLLGNFYKNIGYEDFTDSNYRMRASLSVRW